MNPKRGEIWKVELNPVRGSEQGKTRPVVVMNQTGIGRPSVRICVPVMNRLPVHASMLWCIPLAPEIETGLTKDSTADAAQVRSLDLERFAGRLGVLDSDAVELIAATIALCVGYAESIQEPKQDV